MGEEPNWTKLERKKKFIELKKTLKEVWTTKMETSDESDKDKDAVSVPSHYKKYTIQDRRLVVEQPKRERQPGKSYDGSEDAKKID